MKHVVPVAAGAASGVPGSPLARNIGQRCIMALHPAAPGACLLVWLHALPHVAAPVALIVRGKAYTQGSRARGLVKLGRQGGTCACASGHGGAGAPNRAPSRQGCSSTSPHPRTRYCWMRPACKSTLCTSGSTRSSWRQGHRSWLQAGRQAGRQAVVPLVETQRQVPCSHMQARWRSDSCSGGPTRPTRPTHAGSAQLANMAAGSGMARVRRTHGVILGTGGRVLGSRFRTRRPAYQRGTCSAGHGQRS